MDNLLFAKGHEKTCIPTEKIMGDVYTHYYGRDAVHIKVLKLKNHLIYMKNLKLLDDRFISLSKYDDFAVLHGFDGNLYRLLPSSDITLIMPNVNFVCGGKKCKSIVNAPLADHVIKEITTLMLIFKRNKVPKGFRKNLINLLNKHLLYFDQL